MLNKSQRKLKLIEKNKKKKNKNKREKKNTIKFIIILTDFKNVENRSIPF